MRAPGARVFLTLVTHKRAPILTRYDHVRRLRETLAVVARTRPFRCWAAVILPDHLHLLIELPPGDAAFSTRVMLIKSRFQPDHRLALAHPSASRQRRRERTIWQRRFWEHTIRDDRDLRRTWITSTSIRSNTVWRRARTRGRTRVFTGGLAQGDIRAIGVVDARARRCRRPMRCLPPRRRGSDGGFAYALKR